SGTRKEELLLTEAELDTMYILRKLLGSLGTAETTDLLIERLTNTANNAEFIELVLHSPFAEEARASKLSRDGSSDVRAARPEGAGAEITFTQGIKLRRVEASVDCHVLRRRRSPGAELHAFRGGAFFSQRAGDGSFHGRRHGRALGRRRSRR